MSKSVVSSRVSVLASVVAFSVAGLLATSTQAALIAYEGFDYSAGTPLTGGAPTGGTGWAAGWNQGSKKWGVITSGLSYPGLVVTGNNVGGKFENGADDRPGAARTLSTSISSGTFYVSALFRTSGFEGNNYAYSLFLRNATVVSTAGSFGFRYDTSRPVGQQYVPVIAGSSNVNGNPLVLASAVTGVANDSTNLLVARVNMTLGTIAVFVNPTVGLTEPTPTMSAAFVNTSPINSAGVYGWQRTEQSWDEIRIGNTFADVTPMIPEPASLGLLVLGGLMTLSRRRRSH